MPSPISRRAFTLSELMVAVAVLLVVILATSRIFGTASQVTAIGEATSDLLQEAAAIERQVRSDFARLSRDGVFVIQSHAVVNDINGGVLLNPSLPDNATIRSDQLLFFTSGIEVTQVTPRRALRTGRATANRIYYGHGFQLVDGLPVNQQGETHDPQVPQPGTGPGLITPWWTGDVEMVRTDFGVGTTFVTDFALSAGATIDGTQPEARQWVLARQPVLLADDDIDASNSVSKSVYLFQPPDDPGDFWRTSYNLSAKSLFLREQYTGTPSAQVYGGRVDAAASQLSDIRLALTTDLSANRLLWSEQKTTMRDQLLYFPRAERFAPSERRVDQALTTSVISAACSSFIVEWTWDDGVGEVRDDFGNVIRGGVRTNPWLDDPDNFAPREQPWFGYTDPARGVRPYFVWYDDVNQEAGNELGRAAQTIDPDAIEGGFIEVVLPNAWERYEAFFGYNQSEPLTFDNAGNLIVWPVDDPRTYTPWPSAVRITMTLHDPATNLETGRVFQFVVRLPERGS